MDALARALRNFWVWRGSEAMAVAVQLLVRAVVRQVFGFMIQGSYTDLGPTPRRAHPDQWGWKRATRGRFCLGRLYLSRLLIDM